MEMHEIDKLMEKKKGKKSFKNKIMSSLPIMTWLKITQQETVTNSDQITAMCLNMIHILALIKNNIKPTEAVRTSRRRRRTCSSDIAQVVSSRAGGWQTMWAFVYTIKPWQRAHEGEFGRFSTKCLICRRVKISSLKAYEVALCRMVLCYLWAGCNYSVCTLLHHALRDEKGREEWGESQRAMAAAAREILCSRPLFTTRPGTVSGVCVSWTLCHSHY